MGKAALMLFPASFNIAHGEEYVSSQVMKAGEIRRHGVTLGQSLRLIQKRQRLVKPFAHAKSFGEPDLSTAQRFVVRRSSDRFAVSCNR